MLIERPDQDFQLEFLNQGSFNFFENFSLCLNLFNELDKTR